MSRYTVYVTPEALAAAKRLPGTLRQRVRRSIDGFQADPRPPGSKTLELPETEFPAGGNIEVRRLRLDNWRILYTIREADKVVDILAVRKRPPYDYGDLQELLRGVSEGELPDNP
jgi:mRNA interferase RelE/StbE